MEELLIDSALAGVNSARSVSQRLADQLATEQALSEARAAAKAAVVSKAREAGLNSDGAGGETSGRSALAKPRALFIGDAQAGDVKVGQIRAQAQKTLEDAARAAGIEPQEALQTTRTALADRGIREAAAEIATAAETTARARATENRAESDAVALDDTAPIEADNTAATVSTRQPVQTATADASTRAEARTPTESDGVEAQTAEAVTQSGSGANTTTKDQSHGPGPEPLVELPLGLAKKDRAGETGPVSTSAAGSDAASNRSDPAPLVELPLANGPLFEPVPSADQVFLHGNDDTGAQTSSDTEAAGVAVEEPALKTDPAASASENRPTSEPIVELPLTNGPAFSPAPDPKENFLNPETRTAIEEGGDTVTVDGDAAAVGVSVDATAETDRRKTPELLVELPLTNNQTDDGELAPSVTFAKEAGKIRVTRAGSPEAIVELPLGANKTNQSTDVSGFEQALKAQVAPTSAGEEVGPEPLIELPLTNGPAYEPTPAPRDLFLHQNIKLSLGYAGKSLNPNTTTAAGAPASPDATARSGDPEDKSGPAAPTGGDPELGSTFRTPLSVGFAVLLNEYDPQAPASPRIPAGGLSASLNKLSGDPAIPGATVTDNG